jgi:two-component system nitrogen regulation response regulator GlnG
MSQQTDADRTLPSVVASLPGHYGGPALVLTIIFHPCTDRIGERAVLWQHREREPRVLGRLAPRFGFGGEQEGGDPLGDRHVSRRALELSWRGDTLLVERPADASRCRLLGRELRDSVSLDTARLRQGVSLMLGHSVVLLLRFADQPVTDPPVDGDLGLWGSSHYMACLRQQILRVARDDDDVLIRGETGSGKELVARALHSASSRADGPLVTVNMAAVPADLAAAALFGSTRGAFTGADRDSRGYFQQASGGSLFLDEVGDMPVEVQPQLLRALQQREIQSVGGPVTKVDLRVISATDLPLEEPDCDFRSALRYRLGAVEIRLLPLREHPEDIGELALRLFAACAEATGAGKLLPGKHSSEREIAAWTELFHRLLLHNWPGNVRELSNVCRQVVAASDDGLTIPEHISLGPRVPNGGESPDGPKPARRHIRDVADPEFERAWKQSGFEPAGTARSLGVSRQSVYRRIDGSPRYRLASQVPAEELQRALLDCSGDSRGAAATLRVSLSALRSVLRNSDLEWH